MITVKGTNIRIPQGESGSVVFAFKDLITDYPYILKTKEGNVQAGLFLEIRTSANHTSSEIITSRYYELDNNPDPTDYAWHRFKTTEVKKYPSGGTVDMEQNVLYVKYTGEARSFVFTLDNINEITYDYNNSSLLVSFNRDDTLNLIPRTYFYEISYVEGHNLGTENEEVILKTTLLEPCEFTISGALK